jgi:regulator of RNase E activity RraA
VQDLDKPHVIGAFWGEVNSNIHRSLGCVGTIIDGGIRDLDEMTNAGFKAIARRMCVGHAHSCPVRWGCAVEVFGRTVQPGQLIHADKHGFLAIPPEDEARVLDAARFMDANECQTLIPAARDSHGKSSGEICAAIDEAAGRFGAAAREKFGRKGEW